MAVKELTIVNLLTPMAILSPNTIIYLNRSIHNMYLKQVDSLSE